MGVNEVADQLRATARAAEGAAGYFPALYARVTDRVIEGIAEHRFDDGARMDEFVTRFAGRYLAAAGEPSGRARCWQACWDVASDDSLLIVQHLLLGINAHVNFDLPQTVAALALERGQLSDVRGDFDAVNGILAETSVGVLRDLDHVARWTNEVAALGGGRLFNFSLHEARDQAWRAAERLVVLDEDGQRAYDDDLDELVSVLAYLVTRPAFPVSLLVGVARRLETRDPSDVVAALLGAAAR
jgi:Family of unknown function (DUF5995)